MFVSTVSKHLRRTTVATAVATALAVAGPPVAQGQATSSDPHAAHADQDAAKPLAAQLDELRTKVAKLEAALKQSHQSSATTGGGMAGMGGMSGMGMGGGMGSMSSAQGGGGMMGMGGMGGGGMPMMGGMGGQGMSGMGSMASGQGMSGGSGMSGGGMSGMSGGGTSATGMGGMGMGRMGRMPGGGAMQMPSALPGFPGASHIYHIGATGFFLDHAEHLSLTSEQQAGLNRAKEQALLAQATAERATQGAEQELWTLTASDQPDAGKIEAMVRKVEALRGDRRLAFIRAVGDAAELLTDEQRQLLLGSAVPDSNGPGGQKPSK